LVESGVSIIVPYYNKWPRFKYTLESLRLQSAARQLLEIIVIDDGSQTPLEHLVRELLGPDRSIPRLKIVRTTNRGRSAARNAGAAAASGEILLFVDDDFILPPDFIDKHAAVHAASKKPIFAHGKIYDLPEFTTVMDPETGERFNMASAALQNRGRSGPRLALDQIFGHWDRFTEAHQRLSRLEKLIQRTLGEAELKPCHWVGCVGGNMSVRKTDFMAAGGYDERFIAWGGEDFELGYRLNRLGVDAVYLGDIQAYHITHAHRDHKEDLEVSKRYFIDKHQDACIDYLYDFIQNQIGEDQLIQLWRRVLIHGNDSEACS